MKEFLIEEIKKLPKFELKDIAIKEDGKYIDNQYLKAVIEKGKPELILAIVSDKYKLVQFEDVFIPAIEKIDNIKAGVIDAYRGKAHLEVYPEGEEFIIDKDKRIGLVLKNSVDKAWAVRISFAINSKNFPTIYLPSKIIKGMRKVHRGSVKVVEDFLNVITQVKEAWKLIAGKLQSYSFKIDELDDFAKTTKIGKRIKKKIKKMCEEKDVTLWDVFIKVIDEISKRRFKSEVSKKEKLERISNAIFNYALILNL